MPTCGNPFPPHHFMSLHELVRPQTSRSIPVGDEQETNVAYLRFAPLGFPVRCYLVQPCRKRHSCGCGAGNGEVVELATTPGAALIIAHNIESVVFVLSINLGGRCHALQSLCHAQTPRLQGFHAVQ